MIPLIKREQHRENVSARGEGEEGSTFLLFTMYVRVYYRLIIESSCSRKSDRLGHYCGRRQRLALLTPATIALFNQQRDVITRGVIPFSRKRR